MRPKKITCDCGTTFLADSPLFNPCPTCGNVWEKDRFMGWINIGRTNNRFVNNDPLGKKAKKWDSRERK